MNEPVSNKSRRRRVTRTLAIIQPRIKGICVRLIDAMILARGRARARICTTESLHHPSLDCIKKTSHLNIKRFKNTIKQLVLSFQCEFLYKYKLHWRQTRYMASLKLHIFKVHIMIVAHLPQICNKMTIEAVDSTHRTNDGNTLHLRRHHYTIHERQPLIGKFGVYDPHKSQLMATRDAISLFATPNRAEEQWPASVSNEARWLHLTTMIIGGTIDVSHSPWRDACEIIHERNRNACDTAAWAMHCAENRRWLMMCALNWLVFC